jgi:glycosyltransferase involved in cell wall biosynthesis
MSSCEHGMSRILLVLASSDGGVVRHVADLAAGLAAAGDRVLVAGPVSATGPGGFDDLAGVGVERVDIADRPRPLEDLRAALRLRRLARRADLLHAHGLRAGALSVLATTGLRGRPARVVTLHNALLDGGPRTAATVGRALERIVARGADVVLAVSPDIAERMRRAGARQVEAAVVAAPRVVGAARGAGRQRDPRPALRGSLGVPDGAALLVTVARLAPQKGLPTLADALAELRRARPDLSVLAVVAGDGPLADPLRRDVRARDLPLRLLGRRDDVGDLLAAADLVVVPSIWEGQSLAVQEALRAGAAIVATDAGGTEQLTGNGAVLVPPRDHAALAAAIAALLDDEPAREELRRRAARRAVALPTAADAVAAARAAYRRARPGVSARGRAAGGHD